MADIHHEELKGAQVRSRVEYLENEEKPTPFFLRLEKENGKKNLINSLEIDGKIIIEQNEIMSECTEFYKQLFDQNDAEEEAIDHFFNNIVKIPTLEPHKIEVCEGDITFDELFSAYKQMPNNKAPGIDGLPAEFYKKFFPIFGHDLTRLFNQARREGENLAETQRLALLSLMCKNCEYAHLLKYWRPLSLICVDYKGLTKAITARLTKVMPELVHMDQTAGIPGRSILMNTRTLADIRDMAEVKDWKAALVTLDQQKAFDQTSHAYLHKLLYYYGFGEDFRRWIKLIYKDIKSIVYVNGFMGEPFPDRRSNRQGDPISFPLFV